MKKIADPYPPRKEKSQLMWLPWWVLLFYRPDLALDLNDRNGRADHAKRVAFLAFCVNNGVIVLVVLRGHTITWPDVAILTMMNCAVYGWVGLRTFIASKAAPTVTATSSETVTVDAAKIVESVLKRRNADTGTEPTP